MHGQLFRCHPIQAGVVDVGTRQGMTVDVPGQKVVLGLDGVGEGIVLGKSESGATFWHVGHSFQRVVGLGLDGQQHDVEGTPDGPLTDLFVLQLVAVSRFLLAQFFAGQRLFDQLRPQGEVDAVVMGRGQIGMEQAVAEVGLRARERGKRPVLRCLGCRTLGLEDHEKPIEPNQ